MAAHKHEKARETSNEVAGSSNGNSGTIAGFEDVTAFSQHMLSCMVKIVQSSNGLPPSGDDYNYYTSFEAVREMLGCQQTRTLQGMQELIRHAGVKGNMTPGNLRIDSDDRFDSLVDANDQLLERVGTYLDEAQGHRKPETPLVIAATASSKGNVIETAWNRAPRAGHERKKSANFRLLAARYVQRPQLKFKDKVDNSNRPFCPIIKTKANASKTLEESLQVYYDQNDATSEVVSYPHPYQYELDTWTPPDRQLQPGEPRVPKPLQETPFVFVDTVPELLKLLDTLKNVDAFACDLEHHSYRSFLGITCLMQISTEDCDWLVDTLALRSDMHVLNEVFSDPRIVKVFHGADMDIQWLQRDLGIYVVNMFDTGQSARVLNLARFSLAHLLEKYCDVQADKQYQLADWRIRPLPDELVKYAREDTHYLLYVYARMKNELLDRGNEQKNLLRAVLERSKTVCLQKYERPLFTEANHMDLYYKSRKTFNSQQLAALKALYAWRDKIGRLDDESTGYIMPNHMLLQVADILPRETAGVIAVCNPIPPPVRQYLSDIHRIVQEARKVQSSKVPSETPISKPSRQDAPVYSASSLLGSPHDLSHGLAEQDVRTTKLDPSLIADESRIFGKKTPPTDNPSAASLLSWKPGQKLTESLEKVKRLVASMSNPLERYRKPADAATWQTQRLASPSKDAASSMSDDVIEKNEETQAMAKKRWGTSLTRKRASSPDEGRTEQEHQQPEELPQSVRNQYKKPKVDVLIVEKAATSGLGRELVDSAGNVNRNAIEAEVEARLKEFKAYDYSNSDFTMFESEVSKKKKKKDFRAEEDSEFKTHAKFKAKGKTGKSISYAGKSDGTSGLKWPKNKR